jgi:hypothetical protein
LLYLNIKKIETKEILIKIIIMEDFYNENMSPEELEAIRQMSDAPTLIFMFIMLIVFVISMLFEDNVRGY